MNHSHVIDSWIAELGLSGRRVRRSEEPTFGQALAAREGTRPARETRQSYPARTPFARRPRYHVTSISIG
ncbi:MAG: hypothetical protein M3071_11015 [Actinomycetota bacterium]|nr:hypothetical protein [Actinomycetota bacterium]